MIKKKIKIEGLSLTKKSFSDAVVVGSVYQVDVPRIEVGLESITSIYFGRELRITGIKIFDPQVRILKNGQVQKNTSLSLETGSLYNAISGYLKLFSINSFALENGSVRFEKVSKTKPVKVKVDSIDFSIDNFLLDSAASDSSRFFYTDKIDLVITNQKFNLPDSTHLMRFDEFHISTGTGDVLFKNLQLQPRENVRTDTLESYFNVSIPELNFRGLDFHAAYAENQLLLDSVRILNPTIQIRNKNVDRDQSRKRLDLISLTTKLFETVKVEKLYLDDAHIDIQARSQTHLASYQTQNINIMVTKVAIDSTHVGLNAWPQIFESVELEGRELFAHLMDSTHTIHVAAIKYSSSAANLGLNGISVDPISNQVKPTQPKISIEMEHLNSEGLASLYKLLHGDLSTQSLSITKPNIHLVLPKKDASDSSKARTKSFNSLNIGKLNLKQGNIDIFSGNDEINLENLYLYFNTLSYHPEDLEKLMFSKLTRASDIQLGRVLVNSEKLKLESGKVRLHNWKDAFAEDLYIKPGTVPEPFTFASVRLTEFDLDHFLYNKLLSFDTLIIDKPILNLHPSDHQENNRKNLVKWAHHTEFKEVKVTNGQLTQFENNKVKIHLENFDSELSKFHYDSLKDEYYTLVGYRSDSIYVRLTKIDHLLTGRNLSVSIRDSTLDVKKLRIKPVSSVSENRINVSTHEFKLRQIDFHRLINQQQIHFHNGYLLTPDVHIKLYTKDGQKKELEKDLLKFESLNVSNGRFHFENHLKDSSMVVDANHMNLLIAGFDLGKDSTIFSATNYLADVQGVVIRQYGREDSLAIKKVFVNTKSGHLRITDLRLAPSTNSHVTFPEIEVIGLDPKILAHRKVFQLDSLLIKKPSFVVNLDRPEPAPSNKKKAKVPSVIIKHFAIRGGKGELLSSDMNFGKPMNLNNINVSVDSLQFDSTSTSLQLANHLERSIISLDQLAIATPDSLYDFKIGRITFDGASNQIVLDAIRLDPYYNRRQFQKYIDYQKDWLDLKISSVTLKQLDYQRLIEDKYLNIEEVSIRELDLDTHRDKRLPWPPDSEKPLPQEMISNVKFPFNVDRLTISSAYISHSEFAPRGNLPGTIFFKDIDGEIINITNDTSILANKSFMKFHTTGTLMHTGNFSLDVDFDLTDTTQFFYFKGSLKDMDLTEMNELLEHTAFVHIKDGYNRNVIFNFEANHDYALGKMKFYYDDLKIKVLNPDDLTLKGHGASFKSFFANTFVVNKKNPHFLFVREGDIFHHRDVNRAIFNYWAKSLLSGVVSSIGAKNNKKEIRQLNEELKQELDQKRTRTIQKLNEQASN